MPRSSSAAASKKRSTSKQVAAKTTTTPAKEAAKQLSVSPTRADHDQPKQDLLDSLFPNVDWEGMAEWWNEKAPNWFPWWMGTSITSFARFIFWHSLILTFITPFIRYSTGVWQAEVPSVYYLNLFLKGVGVFFGWFGVSFNESVTPPLMQNITYKVNGDAFTAKNPSMDTAWMMHATAGLTWLCCSYAQIRIVPKSWHPRTGPAVLIVLFIHLGVALNILIHDQQKQNTLNKVALSSLTFIAGTYAMIGTYKGVRYIMSENKASTVARQFIRDHKDRMMIGWLWSISGAGPIRMVAAIMEPIGIGPFKCQEAHGSTATCCLWPYFNRLVMIASWNLLMTGVYCKIQQNKTLTTTWVKNVACHIVVCVSFGLLSFMPGSMSFIDGLLGCATTDKSWIFTYLMWVAQALQITIFFPLLFVLLTVMGPGMLITYIFALAIGYVDTTTVWCTAEIAPNAMYPCTP